MKQKKKKQKIKKSKKRKPVPRAGVWYAVRTDLVGV
jgi:hypothetical protein